MDGLRQRNGSLCAGRDEGLIRQHGNGWCGDTLANGLEAVGVQAKFKGIVEKFVNRCRGRRVRPMRCNAVSTPVPLLGAHSPASKAVYLLELECYLAGEDLNRPRSMGMEGGSGYVSGLSSVTGQNATTATEANVNAHQQRATWTIPKHDEIFGAS
ncbi:hypothetical protein LX32DRAFT_135135 [Colletotrichum zoysiae]|uniref:Uncharacterized protein n=1 Tax=Colletotrichum zoysiae TaxID=1216348 RepID=A0AAD9H6X6_9PEZI|nr:hypothetical protein LX32DRAFT_135135 [Colletotrichum zoysiae]